MAAEKIKFKDNLIDLKRMELMKQNKVGSLSKVWLFYTTPFWRKNGLNAIILSPDDIIITSLDCSPDPVVINEKSDQK